MAAAAYCLRHTCLMWLLIADVDGWMILAGLIVMISWVGKSWRWKRCDVVQHGIMDEHGIVLDIICIFTEVMSISWVKLAINGIQCIPDFFVVLLGSSLACQSSISRVQDSTQPPARPHWTTSSNSMVQAVLWCSSVSVPSYGRYVMFHHRVITKVASQRCC